MWMLSRKSELRPGGQDAPRNNKSNLGPCYNYNIEEWMQDLEEEASNGEVRNGDAGDHGLEQRSNHCQCAGQGSRWCRWQERPQFPTDPSGGSPSSGGGSSDQGNNQSSQWLTMMRVSRESNQSVQEGRGLRVKVNLLDLQGWKDQGML